MKAKVKATGEVLDVETRYVSDNSIQTFEEKDLEFETPKLTEQDTTPCDLWEERRFRASCYAMSSLLSATVTQNPNKGYGFPGTDKIAQLSIRYADALINELKKQSNE